MEYIKQCQQHNAASCVHNNAVGHNNIDLETTDKPHCVCFLSLPLPSMNVTVMSDNLSVSRPYHRNRFKIEYDESGFIYFLYVA